jgi:hypothetical protein
LPQPGDWRQLCILIARINARPLDLSRPLWELYVIEGLDKIPQVPAGSFAILHKIHHAVMDGASAVEMQAALHDFTPEPRYVEPEKQRVLRTPPSPIELGARAYVNALRKPRRILKVARQIMGQQSAARQLPEEERGSAARRSTTRCSRSFRGRSANSSNPSANSRRRVSPAVARSMCAIPPNAEPAAT